jgi:hypothetical protein
MTAQQEALLVALEAGGPQTPRKIVSYLQLPTWKEGVTRPISESAARNALVRLTRRGLVAVTPQPPRVFSITPAGREFLHG